MTDLLDGLRVVPASVWLGLSFASLLLSAAGVLAIRGSCVGCLATGLPVHRAPFVTGCATLRCRPLCATPPACCSYCWGWRCCSSPGQGVLTIVLGLVLTDLPVRDHGLRWVATHSTLSQQLQRWRVRGRVMPFDGLP